MSANIWEVTQLDKLIKLLKENSKKFVILSLILESSPKEDRKMIIKFMKDKYKEFPNITFVLYTVKLNEMNKFDLFKKTQIEEYPYVFHIYDTKNIYITIEKADDVALYEIFEDDKVKKTYQDDLRDFLNSPKSTPEYEDKRTPQRLLTPLHTPSSPTQQNSDLKQHAHQIQQEQQIKTHLNAQQYQTQQNQTQQNQTQQFNQLVQPLQQPQEDPKVIEQKKLLQKLIIYKKKIDEYNTDFLQEIKNRKEEERDIRIENEKSKLKK